MIALITLMGQQAVQAGILDSGTVFEKEMTYENSGWGLEIVNKSTNPIWFIVKNGDEIFQDFKGTQVFSLPGATGSILTRKTSNIKLQIDITEPTELAIWYTNPGKSPVKGKFLGFIGSSSFEPEPNKLYKFTPKKTIYLTWDDKKEIRPETGPLKGLVGKTDTNLSLRNNVKREDIQPA